MAVVTLRAVYLKSVFYVLLDRKAIVKVSEKLVFGDTQPNRFGGK